MEVPISYTSLYINIYSRDMLSLYFVFVRLYRTIVFLSWMLRYFIQKSHEIFYKEKRLDSFIESSPLLTSNYSIANSASTLLISAINAFSSLE